jgi:hypothetical protein
MRIPVALPAQLVQPVRIGVWGSGRSGKSTFLAALPLAALRGPQGRSWMVSGTNEAAAEYLTTGMTRLVAGRRFPTPTQVTTPISWQFSGPAPHAGPLGLPDFLQRRGRSPVEFVLELFDPPGIRFEAGQIDSQLIEILANSAGILYLIDPLPTSTDAFTSFFGTLQQLSARVAANRQMLRGKLPHFVAVCITKFDDETLFRRLTAETTLVTQDESVHWMPRIKPDRTREYFDWVCERMLGGAANVVRDCLDTFFHRKRVAFFASSAIGFRLNPHQVFDFRDFRNLSVSSNEEPLVRDMPRPINVLEPLIYLERHIRAARRT